MKKSILFVALFYALLFTGCVQESTTDISGESGSVFKVAVAESRTSMGEKDATQYPVYWSEDDCLAINGQKSQPALISNDDRSVATFKMDATVRAPYYVTYPYCTSTTASQAKVEFPAEQLYCEGSFGEECAPMCGYATTATSTVTLKHLAGVLRFPVKAEKEGILLDKVVITSLNDKLAGEFVVDCQSGTLTSVESASNSVTYDLPDNFTLSTKNESLFYITIPAGSIGECTVEFIEESGDKMVKHWDPSSDITAGVVREFKSIVYQRGTVGSLTPFTVDADTLIIPYATVYGYVKDNAGNPIKGVAVSDGFTVVPTDENGYYSMSVSSDTWYIYISIPAEYEVPINEYGQPCFYKRYPSTSPQFDFTLTPLKGGKESRFALFSFADPQVSNSTGLGRFKNTAVPNTKKYVTEVANTGMPCYGITLGDIISNSSTNNDEQYRDDMRDGFAVSKIGMPVFQVMGNHDANFYSSTSPIIYPDETSSTFQLKVQRNHEAIFGPVNYSFNRGDVHIVGMRDIVYTSTTTASYKTGFLYAQLQWLRQDLALVPKDKMVILCVHIQLFNGTSNYTQDVLKLLNEYENVHILSGHTHIQHNYIHKFESSPHTNIYEHNTCAFCGAWWSAKIAGDGTPNGFNVWIADGNKLVDWYYMGYSTGANTRSHQMRIYRGNGVTGGEISGTNTYGIKGYYGFNYGDDVILANVYNADNNWKISVYEDGVYSGDMTLLAKSSPSLSSLVGSYTKADPRRAADGVVTSHDFYVAGLHLGILGRYGADGASSGAWTGCYHMYKYTLKNKNATVKVVAKDGFGNEYVETKFTVGTDYTNAKW